MQARAALLLLWAASADDKAMRTLSIGTTGVAVKIRQGPAFDQLFTWSKHLGDRGATHGEASEREQRVHSLVASGAWPSYAWDEYQRLAAGSGQVDSGGLLRDYGVAFSVAEHRIVGAALPGGRIKRRGRGATAVERRLCERRGAARRHDTSPRGGAERFYKGSKAPPR